MKQIYLDHNATTPIHPEAREAMLPFLSENFGNPSSAHWAGRGLSAHIDTARSSTASLIKAEPEDIIFTSCGTEGDNMAIKGIVMKAGKGAHTIISAVEHPAVYSTCRFLDKFGFDFTFVPVDEYGKVDPRDVKDAMRKETVLVSIMLANNETGTINPIKEISSIVHEHGAVMHTDAVQAIGKIPVDVNELGIDMLTASGHKFNAPKGVGFQYIKKGIELLPIISGGNQERGLRSGTENVAGIVALGKACQIAQAKMDTYPHELKAMRDKLEQEILAKVPECHINGHENASMLSKVPNTTNISFRFIEGEALMVMLDQAGIAVSTGSACSTGSNTPSRVLGSMGADIISSRGAIRISLGLGSTMNDVDACLDVLIPAANRLLEISPLYEG